MSDDLPLTRPLKIVRDWLRSLDAVTDLVEKRISWKLTGAYPAIRLADLGPMNRSAAGDWRRVQVECWAQDYDDAEQLAAVIAAAADTSSARGAWANGYCAGSTVVLGPLSSPDQQSERSRHLVDVAFLLFSEPPATP